MVLLQGRARHSIRRRPPSRRHRTSSSGEVEAKDAPDTQVSSTTDPADKTAAGGEQDGERGSEGDVFKKEDQTDAPTAPEKNQTHEEEEPKSGDGDVKEGERGSAEEEEAPSSSEKKEEEPRSPETQKQDPTEDATLTDGKEEEQNEVKYLFSISAVLCVLCVLCVHVLQTATFPPQEAASSAR